MTVMARYKLVVEYDGAPFVGWQRQDNGLSVQAVLETAIHKFCQNRVRVFAAGRTDAGVHALGQTVHADIPGTPAEHTLRNALNYHLAPHPVAVLTAERTDPDFDARFCAQQRVYRYRIINRQAPLTVDAGRAWRVIHPLDATLMQAGADHLMGHHDFTSFRSSECTARSPVKTLESLNVHRDGEEIRIEACARSFMHNQVRIIAGTLKLVGTGNWTPEDVQHALAARDRCAAGPTAPAEGLYLVAVAY